jgi:hypothetical protein
MRYVVFLLLLVWPTLGLGQNRMDDWVSGQLGFVPHFSQSIAWDVADQSIVVVDPFSLVRRGIPPVDPPTQTAWLVGMREKEADQQLVGMALVWSDFPYETAVYLGTFNSTNSAVAFMTVNAAASGKLSPDLISAQLSAKSPSPFLAEAPDGVLFPLGDFGLNTNCLAVTALYQSNQELSALVIVFGANDRKDISNTECAPLTS